MSGTAQHFNLPSSIRTFSKKAQVFLDKMSAAHKVKFVKMSIAHNIAKNQNYAQA
jgi:hypothetical protein